MGRADGEVHRRVNVPEARVVTPPSVLAIIRSRPLSMGWARAVACAQHRRGADRRNSFTARRYLMYRRDFQSRSIHLRFLQLVTIFLSFLPRGPSPDPAR